MTVRDVKDSTLSFNHGCKYFLVASWRPFQITVLAG